jgi:hypothetical protein
MLGQKAKIQGSEEQQAVWEAMHEGHEGGTIHMTSFTTDAADQLANKGPKGPMGKPACTSGSTYGMGLAYGKAAGQGGYIDQWGHKYRGFMSEFFQSTRMEVNEKYPGMWDAIYELQIKARLELCTKVTTEQLKTMADWYGIDMPYGRTSEGTNKEEIATEAVNYCLFSGSEKVGTYDFTDMVWLPTIQGLVKKKFDTLIIDEAQDMGKAQQELMLLSSFRRIIIGDENQAIFMFAGADCDAFQRFGDWLKITRAGLKSFPLNLCRRCSKSVVAEANKFQPDLKALPDAPEGEVHTINRRTFFGHWLKKVLPNKNPLLMGPNDLMIICPTNAPLIGIVFALLKEGVKSYINGGDLTATLVNFTQKHGEEGIGQLRKEIKKQLAMLNARRNSKHKQTQIDKYEALEMIAEQCITTSDVVKSLNSMFSDVKKPGLIELSSIHKAKGREAKNVVVWNYERCKSPYSCTPAQHQQDKNLEYVAYTRAKYGLFKVRSE